MSLINCPECGHEVPDQASVCVHCGFPLARVASPVVLDPIRRANLRDHPICPKCGGTYTGRISLASKVSAHRAIGNGRKTLAGKEFRCLQCKYTW